MDIYEAPIYKSILKPPMILGMPRKLFIFLATMTLSICVGMSQFWFAPVFVILTIIFTYMSKKNIYFFDIILEQIRLEDELS